MHVSTYDFEKTSRLNDELSLQIWPGAIHIETEGGYLSIETGFQDATAGTLWRLGWDESGLTRVAVAPANLATRESPAIWWLWSDLIQGHYHVNIQRDTSGLPTVDQNIWLYVAEERGIRGLADFQDDAEYAVESVREHWLIEQGEG